MPRDGAGNYTLPLPDVIDGTTIDSTWANPTMEDVGDAITDSLDRNGRGGMNVPLANPDGTMSAPGITWANEPQSGFRRAGVGDMRGVINGQDVVQFIDDSGAPAGSQRPFKVWQGSAFVDPLYGTSSENPTFGTIVTSGLNLQGVSAITGSLNMIGTSVPSNTFVPGNIAFLVSNSLGSGFRRNIFNVVDTGVGTYRVDFERNLLGEPNNIIALSGYNDGFGTTFPRWSANDADSVNIDVGDDARSWVLMAVLVDA